MRAPIFRLLAALIVSLTLQASISGRAMGATAAGKISGAEGAAEITRKGKTDAEIVAEGMEVFAGDTLETGDDGLIEIALADGSRLSIASNTKFQIRSYLYNAQKKERSSVFDLLRGQIKATVAALQKTVGSDFKVYTPTAVAGVRGTEFEVEFDDKEAESSVFVYEGSTDWEALSDGKEKILVETGFRARHKRGAKMLREIFDEKARARRKARFALREKAKRRQLRRIERREDRQEQRKNRREGREERRKEGQEDRQDKRGQRRDQRGEMREQRQENRQERREEIRENSEESQEGREERREERRDKAKKQAE